MNEPRLRVDPARERDDLRAYLGDRYDEDRLMHYAETLEAEWSECGDEGAFYRTSEAYLYNLTAFAMTRTKEPYLQELARHVAPGARILDYGCGIGSDGLVLLEAGYRVEFADFDNPSTRYLRWRLERRGHEAPVHDLDQQVPDGFDAAYAFDVIEHVDDPFAFLAEMERRANVVEVNFLDPDPFDQELHRELPVRRLVDHAARGRLLAYKVLHKRSHLVVYRPDGGGMLSRAAGRARVARVRLGARR